MEKTNFEKKIISLAQAKNMKNKVFGLKYFLI